MNGKINKLFTTNTELIEIISKVIHSFRTQNYDKALRDSVVFIDKLSGNMTSLNQIAGIERVEKFSGNLEQILYTQDNRDYILLADLYEMQILKFFMDLQEDLINSGYVSISNQFYQKNYQIISQRDYELSTSIPSEVDLTEIIGSGYELEFSSCGLPTLALHDIKGKFYLHSNNRVSEEAFTLANSWYQEDIIEYAIYGLGLGYHVKELLEIDNSITIEVYEADINIIKLAVAYTDMHYIFLNPNIKLIYDPTYKKLMERLNNSQNDYKFLIHYPSLRNIKDIMVRDQLDDYFMQYSSIENQRKLLNANFRYNIRKCDSIVDELKDYFYCKDLYIIAAGPSLDKNYLLLNRVDRKKSIILSTGTVFHKLMNACITPDYIIITDANERVYGQITGLEDSGIPLLILSTANKFFSRHYNSKKYIILQKDYDKSEAYANENNAMLFQTGGSVSTTALDIGISFGCKRIIFLGLDLAFTDNYVHASETSRRDLASTEDLRQVKDIHGNLIYTSKSLDIYRQWIEKRIRNVKGIEFIDATEGGAMIEGMKIMKLADCIEQ